MTDASISNGTDSVGGLVLVSYSADRVASTVIHNVVGRSSPIAVLGTISARTGLMTFRTDTLTDAEDLMVLVQGKRCVITAPGQPTISGMPFVVTGAGYSEWQRGSRWWYDVRLGFAEGS